MQESSELEAHVLALLCDKTAGLRDPDRADALGAILCNGEDSVRPELHERPGLPVLLGLLVYVGVVGLVLSVSTALLSLR